MGVVFCGEASGVLAAVKTIRSELSANRDFRLRFAREVAVAQRVRGPFLAAVLEADATAPVPWMATEFIDGQNLSELVEHEGPLLGKPLMSLAVGLAEALASIHAAGLVHRDLKPANVVIRNDGPFVVDFGVARSVDGAGLTSTGVAVGSPAFMAPEQALGMRVTAAADVFAWASTLAFAASGRSPFGEGSTPAVLYRIVHESPNVPVMPDPLAEVLVHAYAKSPESRPTAVAVRDRLVHASKETLPALIGDTWPLWRELTRGMALSRRPRFRLVALASFVLVLAVAAGVVWLASNSNRDGTSRDAASPSETDTALPSSSSTESALATTTSAVPVPATSTCDVSAIPDTSRYEDGIFGMRCSSGWAALDTGLNTVDSYTIYRDSAGSWSYVQFVDVASSAPFADALAQGMPEQAIADIFDGESPRGCIDLPTCFRFTYP